MEEVFGKLKEKLLIKVSPVYGVGSTYDYLRATHVRTAKGIYVVPSTRYVDDCQKLLEMENCSPCPTPGRQVTVEERPEHSIALDDERAGTYRSCVGKLIYHSQLRYDIQWCAGDLCREIKSPSEGAWKSLKRLLRYCSGTKDLAQFFSAEGHMSYIEVYVDASWASCVHTRKSVSSGVIRLGGSTVFT